MKTLLITGIAGKSGLVLARLLAEGGAKEPWALRLAVRSEEKAEPVKRILPDAEYCRGDLTDAAYVDTLTKGVDVVLHIAGIGKSLLLAKAAAQNGVKRLVLVTPPVSIPSTRRRAKSTGGRTRRSRPSAGSRALD